MKSLRDVFNQNAGDIVSPPTIPLEHAVRSGQREIVDILLRQGAAVNKANASGESHPDKRKPEKKAIKIMKPIALKKGRRR